MKKVFLSCLAAVIAVTAFAQSTDLVIVPHIEGTLTKFASDQKAQWGWGWSGLFVDLDGTFRNDAFSYSVETRLVSDRPSTLYNYESGINGTWLNWAYLAYDKNGFGFSLGKMSIATALTEYDDSDYDIVYTLASDTWLNLYAYQLGAEFRYSPFEVNDFVKENAFTIQFLTSPYETSLKENMYAINAGWKMTLGNFSTGIFFNTAMGKLEEKKNWYIMASFGARYSFEKCDISIDATNGAYANLNQWNGSEFTGRFNYTGSDLIHFGATFGIQYLSKPIYGAFIDVYPFKNDSFRTYASIARRPFIGGGEDPYMGTLASIGLTYYLDFHFGK